MRSELTTALVVVALVLLIIITVQVASGTR